MPFFILLCLSDCVPGFAPVHANVDLHECQLTFGRTEALLSVPPTFCGTFTREISLTRTVPGSVPSLFQSSNPFVPSSAEKYSALFEIVKPKGLLPPGPGLMS